MTEKKKVEKKNKKDSKTSVAIILVIVILCLFLSSMAVVYGLDDQSKMVKGISSVIPYPAAIIGAKTISIRELDDRLESARRFYESQNFSDIGLKVDFSTPDGEKRLAIKEKYILNKAIEDQIIEIEAKKMGIKLGKEDVDQEVNRKLQESGSGENLKENLKRLYGWDIEDFKEKMVMPDMYREKFYDAFRESDKSFSFAMDKIKKAQAELDQKKDFQEVAKKYSDGDSAKNGGDLGWFSTDEMLPEISSVVFELEKGKRSEIIESSLGYHILRLDDKKNEDGVDKVKISQIFVRTKLFSDFILEKSKELTIRIPLKNYRWDRENGEVEFTNKALEDFENNLDNNSQGDISIMF